MTTRYAIRIASPMFRVDSLIPVIGGALDDVEARALLTNWICAINDGSAHESKAVIEAVAETARTLADAAKQREFISNVLGRNQARTVLHVR